MEAINASAWQRVPLAEAVLTLWRFAAHEDIVPARLLFEPIFFTCNDDQPKPLLRRE